MVRLTTHPLTRRRKARRTLSRTFCCGRAGLLLWKSGRSVVEEQRSVDEQASCCGRAAFRGRAGLLLWKSGPSGPRQRALKEHGALAPDDDRQTCPIDPTTHCADEPASIVSAMDPCLRRWTAAEWIHYLTDGESQFARRS